MSKGSGFTRAVQYFRTASVEEARACLIVCSGIVHERTEEASEPVVRRKRRTKAEIEAARQDEAAQGATA